MELQRTSQGRKMRSYVSTPRIRPQNCDWCCGPWVMSPWMKVSVVVEHGDRWTMNVWTFSYWKLKNPINPFAYLYGAFSFNCLIVFSIVCGIWSLGIWLLWLVPLLYDLFGDIDVPDILERAARMCIEVDRNRTFEKPAYGDTNQIWVRSWRFRNSPMITGNNTFLYRKDL